MQKIAIGSQETTQRIQPFGEFVRLMYEDGFYVYNHAINSSSEEISHNGNKIFIKPIVKENEELIYVFTGLAQKQGMVSRFKLYLEDKEGNEFKSRDNIMISIVINVVTSNEEVFLHTRPYELWRGGLMFDKGIHMDKTKYIILTSIKEIGKFEIEIRDIDLFKKKLT